MTDKEKERLAKAITANIERKLRRIEKYNENPVLCNNCKNAISYEKRKSKYCSHSCSATFNNQSKIKNYSNGLYGKKPCKHCGKTTLNKKFCNKICFQEFRNNCRMVHLKDTGCLIGVPSTIKNYLIEIRGHKCEICENAEWCGEPIPLVLDHINGKPKDGRIVNLRLVCGNCNMQLPTFAGRNVGKGGGRPYRNQRYVEGKSY